MTNVTGRVGCQACAATGSETARLATKVAADSAAACQNRDFMGCRCIVFSPSHGVFEQLFLSLTVAEAVRLAVVLGRFPAWRAAQPLQHPGDHGPAQQDHPETEDRPNQP